MKSFFLFLSLLLAMVVGEMYFDPSLPPMPIQEKAIRSWQTRAFHAAQPRSVGVFTVVFVNGSPPSAAANAIAYAAALLNTFFAPPIPIVVAVSWIDLSGIQANLLGSGGSYANCAHPDNETYPYVLIPSALYSFLTSAPNCPGIAVPYHVSISLTSNPPFPWYLGLSGMVPYNEIDLVTVVLHEIIHGMGMESMMNGDGSYGLAPYGFLYDWYLFASTNNGWPAAFTSPVSDPAITDIGVLTSSVTFHGNVSAGGLSSFAVHTPDPFVEGSSLSHVAVSNSLINRLMFASLGNGQAWHHPGSAVWVAMSTMGYTMEPYTDIYQTVQSVGSGGNGLASFFL